ncbi:hypothetical protein Tco_1148217, partial [Tanacetum coccineum]
ALAQSRDREGHRHLDILNFDLGIMEWNSDKVEYKVVTLEDRVLELEQDGVREENKRLRKKLESTNMTKDCANKGNARGPIGGAGGPAAAPVAHKCSYASFMKCNPSTFSGVEGVVRMCRWFERLESVFRITEYLRGTKSNLLPPLCKVML